MYLLDIRVDSEWPPWARCQRQSATKPVNVGEASQHTEVESVVEDLVGSFVQLVADTILMCTDAHCNHTNALVT